MNNNEQLWMGNFLIGNDTDPDEGLLRMTSHESQEPNSAHFIEGRGSSRPPSLSINYSSSTMIAVTSVLVLMVIATAFGNFLVGLALFRYRSLRTVSNIFIGNLALSDFLLATTILPLSTVNECLGRWIFGRTMCNVWLSLDVLYCTASIWNLCVIALDRYTATLYPLWYREKRSLGQALIYVLVVWVISLSICVPPVLGWGEMEQNFIYDNSTEVYKCVLYQSPGYVLYSACGSFYIPFVVTSFMYIRIFSLLRQRMKRMRRSRELSRQAALRSRRHGQATLQHVGNREVLVKSRAERFVARIAGHVEFGVQKVPEGPMKPVTANDVTPDRKYQDGSGRLAAGVDGSYFGGNHVDVLMAVNSETNFNDQRRDSPNCCECRSALGADSPAEKNDYDNLLTQRNKTTDDNSTVNATSELRGPGNNNESLFAKEGEYFNANDAIIDDQFQNDVQSQFKRNQRTLSLTKSQSCDNKYLEDSPVKCSHCSYSSSVGDFNIAAGGAGRLNCIESERSFTKCATCNSPDDASRNQPTVGCSVNLKSDYLTNVDSSNRRANDETILSRCDLDTGAVDNCDNYTERTVLLDDASKSPPPDTLQSLFTYETCDTQLAAISPLTKKLSVRCHSCVEASGSLRSSRSQNTKMMNTCLANTGLGCNKLTDKSLVAASGQHRLVARGPYWDSQRRNTLPDNSGALNTKSRLSVPSLQPMVSASQSHMSKLAVCSTFDGGRPEDVAMVAQSAAAAQSPETRLHRHYIKRELRATLRMSVIILLFCCMWIGFFVVYVIRGWCSPTRCSVPRELEAFFFWLGYSNSSINPILYSLFNDDFRRAFEAILFNRARGRKRSGYPIVRRTY